MLERRYDRTRCPATTRYYVKKSCSKDARFKIDLQYAILVRDDTYNVPGKDNFYVFLSGSELHRYTHLPVGLHYSTLSK